MMEKKIPEGYKKTEVGEMPEDWNTITYGELFCFLATATYSRAELDEFGEAGYVHYGDIHTKFECFIDCGKVMLPKISKEKIKNYPFLQEGDVLIVDASEDYSGVGKSVEIKNITNKKIISGQHTFLLRDNKQILINGYKGFLHKIPSVKKQMNTLASGLKVYGVSRTNLKRIIIPFPPRKQEQSVIASALSDVDNLITSLEQLIEKKEAIKQGAMQELLTGKRRIASFGEGKGYKQTGIGLIPEDWGVVELGNISFITTGAKDLKDSTQSGKYPFFVRSAHIERINTYSYDGEAILTAGDGDIGKIFHYINGKFDFHQRVYLIGKFSERVDGYFMYLYFSKFFYHRVMSMTAKSTVNSVRMEMISKMLVPLPLIEEQRVIASILLGMVLEIENLERKVDKYKHLKQGMMQNLLTGKIRLI